MKWIDSLNSLHSIRFACSLHSRCRFLISFTLHQFIAAHVSFGLFFIHFGSLHSIKQPSFITLHLTPFPFVFFITFILHSFIKLHSFTPFGCYYSQFIPLSFISFSSFTLPSLYCRQQVYSCSNNCTVIIICSL